MKGSRYLRMRLGGEARRFARWRPRSKLATWLLFISCGIPGLFVLLVASFQLFVSFYAPRASDLEVSPFLSAIGAVAGAILMLVGVRRWNQWGYLLVFFAIPVSLCVFITLDRGGRGNVATIAAFVAFCSFMTLHFVRAYYRTRNQRLHHGEDEQTEVTEKDHGHD
jgi:hypothetical protein